MGQFVGAHLHLQPGFDVVQRLCVLRAVAEADLAAFHRAVQARGVAGVLQRLQPRVVRAGYLVVAMLAEIALAGGVLHHRRLDVVVRRHAGAAAAEQRHVAGQAQRQIDVGAAAGDAPGAMHLRRAVAADAGVGDVGGAAADVHHHRVVAGVAAGVVVHRRGGGFFQERDVVEAGGERGAVQDLQRLRVAGLADRAAELHRAPE